MMRFCFQIDEILIHPPKTIADSTWRISVYVYTEPRMQGSVFRRAWSSQTSGACWDVKMEEFESGGLGTEITVQASRYSAQLFLRKLKSRG